jgi:hypothetical protein
MIELTPEQRRALTEPGPPRVRDPETKQTYVLVREELYERFRPELVDRPAPPVPEVPPGIRRSREALRRDLPQLLENRRLHGRCIAYHGDERIGIARDPDKLLRECIRRGFADDEYYIGVISPTEFIEEEEIVDRFYVDTEEDDTAESAF